MDEDEDPEEELHQGKHLNNKTLEFQERINTCWDT